MAFPRPPRPATLGRSSGGLARPAGVEPAASRLEVSCSIQLSYGRALGGGPSADCNAAKPASYSKDERRGADMDVKGKPKAVDAREIAGREFRYFDFVMVAFVVILLLSTVSGAEKRWVMARPLIGPRPFGAGSLFFPISYVIDDVLTEVYGYARARRAIWAGFGALAFMAIMEWTVVHLPVAQGWTGQPAYERVFGSGWRIILASITAFFVGDFLNSVVLAKMKIWTNGRYLWTRTIGSTII